MVASIYEDMMPIELLHDLGYQFIMGIMNHVIELVPLKNR